MSEWFVADPERGPTGDWCARVSVLAPKDGAIVSETKTCTHSHAHQDTAVTCAQRWARVLNAAAVDPEMVEFQVTFGSQYSPRNQAHPVWPYAHRDGWVSITAPTAAIARKIAERRLGIYWSNIYGPPGVQQSAVGWVCDDFDPTYFPLGELAAATYVRGSNADHVWDESAGERIWATIAATPARPAS